jgi:hypothetical protein
VRCLPAADTGFARGPAETRDSARWHSLRICEVMHPNDRALEST